jgi:hypothetical protein
MSTVIYISEDQLNLKEQPLSYLSLGSFGISVIHEPILPVLATKGFLSGCLRDLFMSLFPLYLNASLGRKSLCLCE